MLAPGVNGLVLATEEVAEAWTWLKVGGCWLRDARVGSTKSARALVLLLKRKNGHVSEFESLFLFALEG